MTMRLQDSLECRKLLNKQQISDAKGSDEVDITSILKDQSNLRGFTSGAIARQSEIESANSDARVGAWANAEGYSGVCMRV